MIESRIYIVEDETLIAMEIADRLTHMGYEVCGRQARGEEAVEEIPRVRPDLVLMDINLAGQLTGIETAVRLRPLLDVPVVFLTAFSDSRLIDEAVGTGAFGYLVKPFQERELHATVQAALYKHQVERLLREDNERLEDAVRQGTEELRESEARFRQIAEHLGEVVWLSDPKVTEIFYVNPAYERIWGRSRESLYQSPREFLEALHPEDHDRVLAELKNHAEGKWNTEYRILRQDGTVRWIQDRGYPLHDEQGGIYRMVGLATDITESKEAAAALEEQATQLRAVLTDLQDAKSLVLRNDKLASLGRLCAGLIHEINNPLNYATQGVRLLLRDSHALPEEMREEFLDTLHDVEEGVARVVGIVSDLRSFTRVTDDRSQTFELRPIVNKTLRFFGNEFNEQVIIETDIPGSIVVRGDPNHVVQALVTLVQNALDSVQATKYEAGVSPWISVTAASMEDRVQLSVRDNGGGILPELMDQIFDPFFTTKDVGEGTGLDLSICHRIMSEHGGGIEVSSEPGVFCEFVLRFPLVKTTADCLTEVD